jgi:hypothetical protein
MIADPRRHFIVTRSAEINDLALTPGDRRSLHFSKNWLGPAAEHAKQAGKVYAGLKEHGERIRALHATFSAILVEDSIVAPSRSRVLEESRSKRPSVQPKLTTGVREEKAEWLRP